MVATYELLWAPLRKGKPTEHLNLGGWGVPNCSSGKVGAGPAFRMVCVNVEGPSLIDRTTSEENTQL